MALFKHPILPVYNLLCYDDDFLILHCSRFDVIHAPFDGEIIKADNSYILHNDIIDLYINHIDNVELGMVKIGDKIGNPIVDKKFGREMATIGIKIYNKNKLSDILVYLKQLDKPIAKPKTKKKEKEADKKVDTDTKKEK